MLKVIVFSRNRPFQLKEYLRTIQLFLLGDGRLDITVIYNYDYKYNQQLNELFNNSITKGVTWLKEEPGKLYSQVQRIVQDTKANHIMFGVDDVLWYDIVDLGSVYEILKVAFSFHCRLNDNIDYSFSCSCPNPRPKAQYSFTSGIKVYDRNSLPSGNEFNYPWELTSAVYKIDDVINYLKYLSSSIAHVDGLNHPNLLEGNGAKHIDYFINQNGLSNLSAYYSAPKLSIITTNIVQDIYPHNPVCKVSGHRVDLQSMILTKENGYLGEGDFIKLDINDFEFDLELYRSAKWRQVHIGEQYLKNNK
jgi:hypothetical protein